MKTSIIVFLSIFIVLAAYPLIHKYDGPVLYKAWRWTSVVFVLALAITGIDLLQTSQTDQLTTKQITPLNPAKAQSSGEEMYNALRNMAKLDNSNSFAMSVQPASVGDVDSMIGKLAARLKKNPQDSKGWRMLGWSYFHRNQYKKAANAYARAVEQAPDNEQYQIAFAQALIKAEGGKVSSQALSHINKVLAKSPQNQLALQLKAMVAPPDIAGSGSMIKVQ